jgi:hypothetical protein
VAKKINTQTRPEELDSVIRNELQWIESECLYNIDQRRRYRAVWLLLRDLIRASWCACFRSGVLELNSPAFEIQINGTTSMIEEKTRLREWLSESRLERLQTFEKFITYMEGQRFKYQTFCPNVDR